jgi:iron complex transport system permease protein
MAISSLVYSFFKGSTFLSSYQLINESQNPLVHKILFTIRLPRTLSAFATGGLLALAGTLMQVLLRNPLADPYVLGVSGGAAIGSLFFLLLGISGTALMGGAWAGSFIAIALVFLLTKNNNHWNHQKVLLTGVALASGFAALISFILIISPEHELRSMLFWLMGDLSYAHLPLQEMGILILGLIISLCLARELNILIRGEKEAQTLGVNTHRLQIFLYLISSALTAAAVTLAGCISFIGLIIPHTLRLLGLRDHRVLLPAAVLSGGTLLTFADTLARTLWNPQQVPVGIIMALIGIPIFLFILQKNSA